MTNKNTNIFGAVALKYHEMGYNVLPLIPETKKPFHPEWQQWCSKKQTTELVKAWIQNYHNHNIGIPLGIASNIIALDFDYDIDGLHDQIIALLPDMPVIKKGAKGFTAFFRCNGESPRKWKQNHKPVLELLSTGNQTVVPPSIHPDTQEPYTWLTLDDLSNIRAEDLPTLPKNFIDDVNELFGYNSELQLYDDEYCGELPDIEEVKEALEFICPDEYDTWLRIGMALHHSYDEDGFAMWDEWSQSSDKYDENAMQGKWDSFGKSTKVVTVGTILLYAFESGYIRPNQCIVDDFDIITDDEIITGNTDNEVRDLANTKVPDGTKDNLQTNSSYNAQSGILESAKSLNHTASLSIVSHHDVFPESLLNAPGLPGEIAELINRTSHKRQPILAIGAAICASGTIFAQRVCSDSDLRTNFMVLGLAESGCGKEHARQAINKLFNQCGISYLILGDFASDAGLLTALKEASGIGFAMLDEIGHEIKAINNKGSGGHEKRILTTMMKLFSRANGIYHGKQYANHDKKQNRIDIEQPCLNIYGTTVPKRLFDALTSDDAIDGFLARWLVFTSNDIDPPMQQAENVEFLTEILISNIKDILAMPTFNDMFLDSQTTSVPKIIPFTEGAEGILEKFSIIWNKNRIAEIKSGGNLAPIWTRTREHAIKLALVAHPYSKGIIDNVTMQWACDMALYLSNVAIKAIRSNVSDSEYERNMKRIHGIIKRHNEANHKPMPNKKLVQQTAFISTKERGLFIHQLLEAGYIDVVDTGKKYRGKPCYEFNAHDYN